MKEVYLAVRKHRRAAGGAAGFIFLSVVALTAISSRWYRSEARLFVRIGRESVALDPTATTTGQVLPVQGTRDNEINSVHQLLLSQEVAAAVVDHFGPSRILYGEASDGPETDDTELGIIDRINPLHVHSPRDLATKKLSKHLEVAVEKDSSVIAVRYEATDPALARDVVQQLIDCARETHLRVHSSQGSEGFFAEQSAALRDRVQTLEGQLRDLRNASSVPDVRRQRDIQVQRIGKLDEQAWAVKAEIAGIEAELAAQRDALAEMPETIQTAETTGLPNTAAEGMRQQLFALQIQEKQLLSKNQEASIQVRQIRDQVKLAKAELDEHQTAPQITRGINQPRLDLLSLATRAEANLAGLKKRSAVLEAQAESERAALARLNDYEVKLNEVERRLELEVASYRRYVEKLEQSRIDRAMERNQISNLNVLQQPTFSVTPLSPHVALNLAIGLILSLISSIAVGVSLEMFDSSAVLRFKRAFKSTAPLSLTPGAARA